MRSLLFVLTTTAMLNSCGKSIDVVEWIEEVKLHDGQMLEVWRKARAYSGGFPNSKRGRDIDFELKYPPLNVQWKTTLSDALVRHPMSFEIFDGMPHLVLYIGDRESCSNRPKTDYSAQFLRWTNGEWVEIKQADFPVDKALINLYAAYWGHSKADDAKGLVSWGHKSEADGFNPSKPDTIKSYFERGRRFCSRFVTAGVDDPLTDVAK